MQLAIVAAPPPAAYYEPPLSVAAPLSLADAQPVRLAAPQATELSDDEQQTALIAGFIIAFGLATMLSGGCKLLRERRPPTPTRRRPAAPPRKTASKYQRAPLAADEEAAPPPRRAPGRAVRGPPRK